MGDTLFSSRGRHAECSPQYHAFRNSETPSLTHSQDDTSTATDRQNTDTPLAEGYKWTCPYCGTTRTNTAGGPDGEANATVALRNHITTSAGGGHHPRNEFPPEEVSLTAHVTRVRLE